MTNEGDDLVTRVVAVEQEVRLARRDAAAALVLARAADHDVATMNEKLSGHVRVLNALRETQMEHGAVLREHGERLDRVEQKVDAGFRQVEENFRQVGENFRQVDEKFAQVRAGIARIEELLTADRGRDDRA